MLPESHLAFMRRICENPDDDTSRLVYADFLDDQEWEHWKHYAEFIRLDIMISDTVREQGSLNSIYTKIIAKHHSLHTCIQQYIRPLQWPGAKSGEFSYWRGMIGGVHFPSHGVLHNQIDPIEFNPVTRIKVAQYETYYRRFWFDIDISKTPKGNLRVRGYVVDNENYADLEEDTNAIVYRSNSWCIHRKCLPDIVRRVSGRLENWVHHEESGHLTGRAQAFNEMRGDPD